MHLDPDALFAKPRSRVRRWQTFSNELAAYVSWKRDEAAHRSSD